MPHSVPVGGLALRDPRRTTLLIGSLLGVLRFFGLYARLGGPPAEKYPGVVDYSSVTPWLSSIGSLVWGPRRLVSAFGGVTGVPSLSRIRFPHTAVPLA